MLRKEKYFCLQPLKIGGEMEWPSYIVMLERPVKSKETSTLTNNLLSFAFRSHDIFILSFKHSAPFCHSWISLTPPKLVFANIRDYASFLWAIFPLFLLTATNLKCVRIQSMLYNRYIDSWIVNVYVIDTIVAAIDGKLES